MRYPPSPDTVPTTTISAALRKRLSLASLPLRIPIAMSAAKLAASETMNARPTGRKN